MINIKGLDKKAVFVALYNRARTQGRGFQHYDPNPLSNEEVESLFQNNPNLDFDYVKGRVMKVRLSKDEFDEYLYDRDNGQGAAEKAIDQLKRD